MKCYLTEASVASPYGLSTAPRVLGMRGEYDACANNISKTSVFAPIYRRTGNTRSAALLLSVQCRDVPSKQCASFQPCVGHVGRALVVS